MDQWRRGRIPDDPSGLDPAVWPGEPADPDVRRWPARWLLTFGRGVTPGHVFLLTLALADKAIAGYDGPQQHNKGPNVLSEEGVAFVRGTVRDALIGAPEPLTTSWVKGALSITGSLAASVEAAWVASLAVDTRRRRFAGVLGLAAGCELRKQEIVTVRGTDVTRDERGVHVRVREFDPRTATCLAAFEDILADAAAAAGTNVVACPWSTHTTPYAIDGAMQDLNGLADPPTRITLTWLRTTWMVRHLEAGTPLAVFLPASGLKTTGSLDKLMAWVEVDPDPAWHLRHAAG